MRENFVCPKCGNSDERYIGYRNGEPYCRFCISMKGKEASEHKRSNGSLVLNLKYHLSKEQKSISDKLVKNYQNKIDTLINAVCGAGKTELVYGLIGYCLSLGRTVAFAVPRRDVVIELYARISEVFSENRVVAVYGGHTENLDGDIVVLTTHQLYRYDKYFDLIILDEIDAFPFKNNKLLASMFFRAVKGSIVMMSATPSKDVIEFFSSPSREIFELNTRFHRHPLPVPVVVRRIGLFKIPFLVKTITRWREENKRVFIFAPTIAKCEFLHKILGIFIKNGTYVHSKCKQRNKIISDFKKGKYEYLVTTAVLERGVTFKDLQVIICDADNELYDYQTLIQIAGRVGRKIDAPEGEVIYLVNKTTSEIKDSIDEIKRKNGSMQDMF